MEHISSGRALVEGSRLDAEKGFDGAIKGAAGNIVSNLVVAFKAKLGEDDEGAIFVAVVATAMDVTVYTEAIERKAETRDVVHIRNNCSLPSRIIGYNVLAGDGDLQCLVRVTY